MSMHMSLALTKPSTTCINLHVNGANSKRQSSLALRSSRFSTQHGFNYYLGSSRLLQRSRTTTVRSSVQPVPPPTPPPINSSPASSGFPGKGWIAGIVLSLLLPFLKNKWGALFFLKKDVADQKLQEVENLVETLEKVADTVEHLAGDVGKDLPDGSFKRAANLIEDAAVKVEAAAHITDAAIDKIQAWEEEVDSIAKSEQVKASN